MRLVHTILYDRHNEAREFWKTEMFEEIYFHDAIACNSTE